MATFNITAQANDGQAARGYSNYINTYSNIRTSAGPAFVSAQFTTVGFFQARAAWQVFKGITIPKSSTIDEAILKVNGVSDGGGFRDFSIVIDDKPNPNSTTPSVPVSAGVVLDASAFTVGPFLFTVSHASPTTSQYQTISADVGFLVQTMVNLYDYTNANMVFYEKVPGVPPISPAPPRAKIATFFSAPIPSLRTQLVINYTAPLILVDKTTYRFK